MYKGSRSALLFVSLAIAACGSQPRDDGNALSVVEIVSSEIPSKTGEGPFIGAYIGPNGLPTLVRYRNVHGRAVVGGDMIIGAHKDMRDRVRKLLLTVDPRLLSLEDQALAKLAREQYSLGDLRPSKEPKSPTEAAGILGWGTLGAVWPAKVIPYAIDASIPNNDARRTAIAAAVTSWNAQSTVDLKLASTMTPQEIGKTATLVFVDHEEENTAYACSSIFGYNPTGGKQKIYLNPGCKKGNIMHEIGHALGLDHEHQRDDRATYLSIASTIPSDPDNYDVTKGRKLSSHDLCSIMHYSADTTDPVWFKLTKAGEKSLETCAKHMSQGCGLVGQRCQLSPADQSSIKVLYP